MDLISFALPNFASSEIWMSLLTLTFLEIVLGIDNIIFITIAASKLPEKHRRTPSNIGLAIAFSLFVGFLNIGLRKKSVPVKLHDVKEEAKRKGIL